MASSSVIGVGKYSWLSFYVLLAGTSGNLMQKQGLFTYSFDVAGNAAQA